MVNTDLNDWDETALYVTFTYNNAKHTSNTFMPFYLMRHKSAWMLELGVASYQSMVLEIIGVEVVKRIDGGFNVGLNADVELNRKIKKEWKIKMVDYIEIRLPTKITQLQDQLENNQTWQQDHMEIKLPLSITRPQDHLEITSPSIISKSYRHRTKLHSKIVSKSNRHQTTQRPDQLKIRSSSSLFKCCYRAGARFYQLQDGEH